MKGYLYSIILFFIFALSCAEKSCNNPEDLLPYKNKQGKWGYRCDFTRRTIISCKYDLCYPFVSGRARVVLFDKQSTPKYGLIDEQGNQLTECIYDDIAPFESGFSIVCRNEKYSLLDLSGQVVSNRDYEEMERILDHLFVVVYKGLYGCIDSTGKEIISCEYQYISALEGKPELFVHLNDIKAYFNSEGKQLTSFKYKDIMPFYEDYTTVVDTAGLCGFLDRLGKERLFPPGYDIYRLWEGVASLKKDNQFGYINTDGKILFLKDYWPYETREYANGLVAYIGENEKWGFYDKNGNKAIPFMYDNVNDFFCNYCSVYKKDKMGLINKQNEIVIPFEYDYLNYINDSIIMAKLNGKWGILTIHGKSVLPHLFDGYKVISEELIQLEVTSLRYYSDKHLNSSSSYGFYNSSKEKKEVELAYGYVGTFQDSLCMVFKNGKMGFINYAGDLVIPCIYDLPNDRWDKKLTLFRWEILPVSQGSKKGYIDEKGNEYWIKE